MAHIVILGAGLGGVPMALEMRREARRDDEVTVVSDRPSFDFTPSNPWVGVGWREPDDIRIDLAPVFRKRRIGFIEGRATKVDPHAKLVEVEGHEPVSYDYLVIATGPKLDFAAIPGLGPDAGYTQSVCTTSHAHKAFNAWQGFTKNPGPIVVGAAQGASCFGPAYEYALILDTELRRQRIRDRVPMTFVTSEPYIGHLGLDGVGDTKGLLESELRERHIKFITSARITDVRPDAMTVEEVATDGAVKARREVPHSYAMILPGFKGIDALQGIGGLVNDKGFVVVDRTQRNDTYPEVFAVGVCVAIPPVETYAVPVGVPKTGFMIESMVRATAHNIRALMDGKETRHEATWNALCLADFGDRGAAFLAIPQIPPRNVNWSAEGRWVHLAKIAFEKYFINKMRSGVSEPFYERAVLDMLGITKLRKEA